MDRKRLEAQLVEDEGKRLIVYKDSLGFPTVGIGHLVTKADGLFVGDTISDERCDALFQADLDNTIKFIQAYHQTLMAYEGQPDTVQEAIVNMCFNLGIKGLLGFPHFLADLAAKNYEAAAHELETSLWSKQVGARAARIVSVIRQAGAL